MVFPACTTAAAALWNRHRVERRSGVPCSALCRILGAPVLYYKHVFTRTLMCHRVSSTGPFYYSNNDPTLIPGDLSSETFDKKLCCRLRPCILEKADFLTPCRKINTQPNSSRIQTPELKTPPSWKRPSRPVIQACHQPAEVEGGGRAGRNPFPLRPKATPRKKVPSTERSFSRAQLCRPHSSTLLRLSFRSFAGIGVCVRGLIKSVAGTRQIHEEV